MLAGPIMGTSATFKIVLNVLVNFLWFGGLVFTAGLWPFGLPDATAPGQSLQRCLALPSLPDLPEAMWGRDAWEGGGEDVRW